MKSIDIRRSPLPTGSNTWSEDWKIFWSGCCYFRKKNLGKDFSAGLLFSAFKRVNTSFTTTPANKLENRADATFHHFKPLSSCITFQKESMFALDLAGMVTRVRRISGLPLVWWPATGSEHQVVQINPILDLFSVRQASCLQLVLIPFRIKFKFFWSLK